MISIKEDRRMEGVNIHEEFFVEDSRKELKEKLEDSTKAIKKEYDDTNELDIECAVDNRRIEEKEEIHAWSCFKGPQEIQRNVGSSENYECTFCRCQFPAIGHLKVHLRSHQRKTPHKCNICKSMFTDANHLGLHMRIHTGEKPYRCELCEAKYSYPHFLRNHIKTVHLGEKPFSCEICGRKFSRSNHFVSHMKVHAR